MVQLVVLILHDPANTDAVVREWLQAGVRGMTLLDSSGLSRFASERDVRDDVPLFPSLRLLMREMEEAGRMLLSVVPEGFDVEALVQAAEKHIGSLDLEDTGILFVVPVSRVVGLQPPNSTKPDGD